MNTATFMLRCVEMKIAIHDLDLLTIGLVNDMFVEKANDDFKYDYVAEQSDFDKF